MNPSINQLKSPNACDYTALIINQFINRQINKSIN